MHKHLLEPGLSHPTGAADGSAPAPLPLAADVYIALRDSAGFGAWAVRTLIRLQESTGKSTDQRSRMPKNRISSRDQGRNKHI